MEWILTLHLHVMNAKTEAEAKSKYLRYGGFSSEADCWKAADAAGEIFMLRDGIQNGIVTDCRKGKATER